MRRVSPEVAHMLALPLTPKSVADYVRLELIDRILPLTQYYAYVEISAQAQKPLWQTYTPLQTTHPRSFAMQRISGARDIYPVFHELFRKQSA